IPDSTASLILSAVFFAGATESFIASFNAENIFDTTFAAYVPYFDICVCIISADAVNCCLASAIAWSIDAVVATGPPTAGTNGLSSGPPIMSAYLWERTVAANCSNGVDSSLPFQHVA